jgi:hypothetical protein
VSFVPLWFSLLSVMKSMDSDSQIAVVYGVNIGSGGLGVFAANALTGLAKGTARVDAFGPEPISSWALPGEEPAIDWHHSPQPIPGWASRYTPLRWYHGRLSMTGDWAAGPERK